MHTQMRVTEDIPVIAMYLTERYTTHNKGVIEIPESLTMVEEDEIDSATQPEIKDDILIPQTNVKIIGITNMTSETNNLHGNRMRKSMTNRMPTNL